MNYIISDIHGDKKKFLQMLKLISFDRHTDRLYILGDVLDRGKYGIEILDYIRPYILQGSMIMIKGNHEMFCQSYLEGLLDEKRWIGFGGDYTLRTLKMMDDEYLSNLRMFLKELPYYVEIETKRWGKVCLTHSGIDLDYIEKNEEGKIDVVASIERGVMENEWQMLISDDLHLMGKADLNLLNQYIICGHTPMYTSYMNSSDRIYIGSHYMDVDCGCGFTGGTLGCYCVESEECFYC